MAEEKEVKVAAKPKKTKTNLVGASTKPAPIDTTPKIDIDLTKSLIDNIIGTGLTGGLNTASLDEFTTISNARDTLYQTIDSMAKDSSVSSVIRTYADDICAMSDDGHIMWAESDNPNISKFVNYLLNIMNVDKNIYKWAYNLIQYGDVYLRLYRESDYADELFNKEKIETAYSARNVLNEDARKSLEESVRINMHSSSDPYSYYVEMVADPSSMYELTKYGKTYGYVETPNASMPGLDYVQTIAAANNLSYTNYRMKSGNVNIYQADDFVHACLDDNYTRYPETVDLFITDADYKNGTNAHTYSVKRGKSMLFDSYKIWREKSLLENSVLLNRVTRSSILRKVSVEVGDMPKEQVSQTLRRVKEMMENKTALNADGSMMEHNNPGPIENFIYFATHNGQGAITVDSVGGDVNVKDLADLDTWINKFYGAYGIPKQYFGFTDDGAGFNGGTALTIISSVYSKGVVRVQNALIQMITDAINLFLLQKGCRSYLNNFTIKMKTPTTQEEINYREALTNRVTAISNLNGLFGDVEDKVRKLSILKYLVRTLGFSGTDDIIEQIDAEIAATKEANKKAAEAEALEAAEAAAEAEAKEAPAAEAEPETSVEEPADDGDMDLGLSSIASMESVTSNGGNTILVEGPDIITEDEETNLPKPEDIEEDIDFSENN